MQDGALRPVRSALSSAAGSLKPLVLSTVFHRCNIVIFLNKFWKWAWLEKQR